MKRESSLFAAALLALTCSAHAQEAPSSFNAMGFSIKPLLTVTSEYNDNIYTEDAGEEADVITKIKPEVTIESTGSPNTVAFRAGLTQALYAGDSNNNYLNYNAGVKTHAKLGETLDWDAALDYRHMHAARGDDQADPTADASEPLPYNIARANTSITKTAGALEVQPRIGFTQYDYDSVRRNNGTLIDQEGRDRMEYMAGGRASYDIEKNIAVFAQLEYTPIVYDRNDANARNSDGGSVLLGFKYEPSKEFAAEIATGRMQRNYDRAIFEDISAMDAQAKLEWTFAPDTTLQASLKRSIADVTDANTGGSVRTNVKFGVSGLLGPGWSGKVEGRYLNSAFEGGNGATSGMEDREDHYYEALLGAAYALTDKISLTFDYSFGKNQSNRDISDYDRNIFMVGLAAAL